MQNFITIVNQDDEVLEYLDKLSSHNKDTKLHRGISVFLITNTGKIILQCRSEKKITWPNFWSNAVCGHPSINEIYIDAAMRHLKHELNLENIHLIENGVYRYNVLSSNRIRENEICHVFVGIIPDNEILSLQNNLRDKNINFEEINNLAAIDLVDFQNIINPMQEVKCETDGTIKITTANKIFCQDLQNYSLDLQSKLTPWCIFGFYISKLNFYSHIKEIFSKNNNIIQRLEIDINNISEKTIENINFLIEKLKDKKFCQDSRQIKDNEVFLAIKNKLDGHNYILDVIKKGVKYLIIEYLPENAKKYIYSSENNENQEITLIYVKNTYQFLVEFARYKRIVLNDKTFVGITGSVGKTSLKRFFSLCLDANTNQGNQNNHFGLPFNLINLPNNDNLNVLEMGMNHTGEIDFLSNILIPNYAIITNISPVHIEYFKSLNDIAKAKAEVFNNLKDPKTVILPKNSKQYNLLSNLAKQVGAIEYTFGGKHNLNNRDISDTYDNSPTCYLKSFEFINNDINNQNLSKYLNAITIKAIITIFDQDYTIECQYIPEHILETLLSGILFHFLYCQNNLKKPFTSKEIEILLSKYSLEVGRGELIYVNNFFGLNSLIFDDAYNASPTSMTASLENFLKYYKILNNSDIKKIAILGDMLELGQDAEKYHEATVEDAIKHCHIIILCGKFMKLVFDKYQTKDKQLIFYANNYDDVVEQLKQLSQLENIKHNNKNLILIKASNSIGLHKLVKTFYDSSAAINF